MKKIQKKYIGVNGTEALKGIVGEVGAKKVFVVCGKTSYQSSCAKSFIEQSLEKVDVFRFSDFTSNPKYEESIEGAELFSKISPDLIVAIGGGSAIDIAKCINVAHTHKHISFLDIVMGRKNPVLTGVPLVAIPTTSGSGSEATNFAAIYKCKIKYSISAPFMQPEYAIIDPSLTLNLPRYISAYTGFDALCHAVESFLAITSNTYSRFYARQAITLALDNIVQACSDPTIGTRFAMAKAAHLAGKAINITKTTAPHAISYAITNNFQVPHGHAVALTLGYYLKICFQTVTELSCRDLRGINYVKNSISDLLKFFEVESVDDFVEYWYQLMNSCKLESRPDNLGIKCENDIEIIANNINSDRMKNSPVKIDKRDVREIFISLGNRN
jgi:alcohol dehydrogenase class IV